MRETCERPGCHQAVVAIYGLSPSGDDLQMWIDVWSSAKAADVTPPGARGVLCARHGELFSAPRGWTLEDRRDSVPRLFKPRNRPTVAKSGDITHPTPRRRPAVVPRPQLFIDLPEVAPEPEVAETTNKTATWSAHFDPDDDVGGMLEATGPMLRDAFRPRHNGRRDATPELQDLPSPQFSIDD